MSATTFLTRTRGQSRLDWTDWLSYAYLCVGLFTMFAPIVWLVMSSFKTESAISQFPPSFLPYSQKSVQVVGHDKPLPLFMTKDDQGRLREMAQVRRIGIMATMVDPANPASEIRVNINDRKPVNELKFAGNNYTDLFGKFSFGTYLWNSVFITVVATLLTLLVNSMAAFALSKYQFRGQKAVFMLIIATLMIPPTIILVPVFLVINSVGLLNSLWGVILPAIATPTGVFLLRQYMLTIPDELLEAARMDHASEWRIYWKIVLPLAAPALAVLAIFSVMWRWNDFLLPLIVLSKSEFFTLQLALNSFQGELNTQWHYLLAMTVITLIPITLVFAFLQKYITTGIASAGVKIKDLRVATLELDKIVKTFDRTTILHGIDLCVKDGEFVVFVGPSGCGKSTLLRAIAGLDSPSSGDIRIDGQNVNAISAAHRGCAMVFQSYALYPHMTVYDNMAFGLENLGLPQAQIEAKVGSAATLLRLGELLQRKPTQLSGGQRQRVAIGRAIVREPKLFLFDEPLSNLDAELRVSMRAEIRDLHARLKATMVYVTHDQVEAMTMADKIVVLRAGRVEQVGAPLELYNRPVNTFVAGFIGSPRMNFLPIALLPPDQGATLVPPGTHTIGLRPEHALIGTEGPIAMRVSSVEQLGASSLLHGSVGSDTPFEMVCAGQTAIAGGDTVRLALPREHLHCFDKDGRRL